MDLRRRGLGLAWLLMLLGEVSFNAMSTLKLFGGSSIITCLVFGSLEGDLLRSNSITLSPSKRMTSLIASISVSRFKMPLIGETGCVST